MNSPAFSAALAGALALSIAPASAGMTPPPPTIHADAPAFPGIDPIVTGPTRPSSVPSDPIHAGARALLLAAVGTAAAAEVEAAEGAPTHAASGRAPMPFDIIRSLQFLQDQIARGNDRAIRVQALLLRRFGPTFLDAGDAAWADERNRRAAVLFVLSGGPPQILDGLLKRGVLPESERALFEGALAYVRNDLMTARERLGVVDLDHFEPGLAGHIHLVLGQILENDEPARALFHLDRARLLAPGGLIEESALRMAVLLAEELGEPARADVLARQYLDRYYRSSYAANFEARFVAVQAGRGAGADASLAMKTMADVVGGLPDDRRQRLFLAVARRALVEGHQAYAGLVASAALEIAPISEVDRARATLYELASRVTRPGLDAEAATAALASIDRNLLHPQDQPLLDGAQRVLSAIGNGMPALASARTAPGVAAEPTTETASLPVIDRALRVLNEVDGQLRENQ